MICCFCSVGVGILLSVTDKMTARHNNVMSYPSKLANYHVPRELHFNVPFTTLEIIITMYVRICL